MKPIPARAAAALVAASQLASTILALAGRTGPAQAAALALAAPVVVGVSRPRVFADYFALLASTLLALASSLAGGWAGGASLALLAAGLSRVPVLALPALGALVAGVGHPSGCGSQPLALAALAGAGAYAVGSLLEPRNLGFTLAEESSRRAAGLALSGLGAALAFAPLACPGPSMAASFAVGAAAIVYASRRAGGGVDAWALPLAAYAAAALGALLDSVGLAGIAAVIVAYSILLLGREDSSRWMSPMVSWMVGLGLAASLSNPQPLPLLGGAVSGAGLALTLYTLDYRRLSVEGVELVEFTRRLCDDLSRMAPAASTVYPGARVDAGECTRLLLDSPS